MLADFLAASFSAFAAASICSFALFKVSHGLYKTFYEDAVSNIRRWLDAPHSRPPQSSPEQDRECCGHNHEIYPRAVQGEIHDGDKEQRKQRNSRHSGDSC